MKKKSGPFPDVYVFILEWSFYCKSWHIHFPDRKKPFGEEIIVKAVKCIAIIVWILYLQPCKWGIFYKYFLCAICCIQDNIYYSCREPSVLISLLWESVPVTRRNWMLWLKYFLGFLTDCLILEELPYITHAYLLHFRCGSIGSLTSHTSTYLWQGFSQPRTENSLEKPTHLCLCWMC